MRSWKRFKVKTYLENKTTYDGKSETDIKSRKHRRNRLSTLIKSFVWSIAIYGAETRTILKAERKRIEAFDTWCWRRTRKISWTQKAKNEEVYSRTNERKTLWKTIGERRKTRITTVMDEKIERESGNKRL